MIAAAPSVMERLRKHKVFQAQRQLLVGELWNNPNNLGFTDNVGGYLTKPSIYRDFKAAVRAIVRPDARFHDLRHPNVKLKTHVFQRRKLSGYQMNYSLKVFF